MKKFLLATVLFFPSFANAAELGHTLIVEMGFQHAFSVPVNGSEACKNLAFDIYAKKNGNNGAPRGAQTLRVGSANVDIGQRIIDPWFFDCVNAVVGKITHSITCEKGECSVTEYK
jgi:hypothetical protein